MNKYFNQKGLTLIELLASLIITITLSIFAFNLLSKGLDHYENIKSTNSLRDEADYLMAVLVKEIYTTKETEITAFHSPQKNTSNYFFEVTKTNTNYKTGFINGELIIKNNKIGSENPNIIISDKSIITVDDIDKSIYKINLVLVNKKKKKEMNFENEIRTINDKEEN